MDTQRTWLRLVIAAAMHTFKRSRKRARFGHRCLFLIDEFAALGRIDDMPRDIATMGGFGVDFALVVQGLDQLKDHYGEAKGTILSNCAYKWFCNINDLDSAKYLSDTLGKKTVVTTSTSDSTSSGQRERPAAAHSTTHGETGALPAESRRNPQSRERRGHRHPAEGPPALRQAGRLLGPGRGFRVPAGRTPGPCIGTRRSCYDENPYVAGLTPSAAVAGSDKQRAGKAKARTDHPRVVQSMTVVDARDILGVKAERVSRRFGRRI